MILPITATVPASIIVFDSGIGGLSVAEEIRRQLPYVAIDYVADNRIYPYGLQEEQVLIDRVCALMSILEPRFHPNAIVVACNSASTVVLDALRQQTKTPVIGVVPAIKPAAELTRCDTIGLLATPGTANRHYTQRLIDQFAGQCKVIKVGTNTLVGLAEDKLRGLPVDAAVIADVLAPFTHHQPCPDVIVLGCTHFPFLHDDIAAALPASTRLLDSGTAIARRTHFLLDTLPVDRTIPQPATRFLFTQETDYAHRLQPALQAMGYGVPEFLHL